MDSKCAVSHLAPAASNSQVDSYRPQKDRPVMETDVASAYILLMVDEDACAAIQGDVVMAGYEALKDAFLFHHDVGTDVGLVHEVEAPANPRHFDPRMAYLRAYLVNAPPSTASSVATSFSSSRGLQQRRRQSSPSPPQQRQASITQFAEPVDFDSPSNDGSSRGCTRKQTIAKKEAHTRRDSDDFVEVGGGKQSDQGTWLQRGERTGAGQGGTNRKSKAAAVEGRQRGGKEYDDRGGSDYFDSDGLVDSSDEHEPEHTLAMRQKRAPVTRSATKRSKRAAVGPETVCVLEDDGSDFSDHESFSASCFRGDSRRADAEAAPKAEAETDEYDRLEQEEMEELGKMRDDDPRLATVLFSYPEGDIATNPVSITLGDLRRLRSGQFLNDNLIDFWLKWSFNARVDASVTVAAKEDPERAASEALAQALSCEEEGGSSSSSSSSSAVRRGGHGSSTVSDGEPPLHPLSKRVHIFNSHFYTKLTEEDKGGDKLPAPGSCDDGEIKDAGDCLIPCYAFKTSKLTLWSLSLGCLLNVRSSGEKKAPTRATVDQVDKHI